MHLFPSLVSTGSMRELFRAHIQGPDICILGASREKSFMGSSQGDLQMILTVLTFTYQSEQMTLSSG
jgi:hypothetical protein